MRPRLWLAIFIVLQLADGLLTYAAVERFGTAAEGNPILATWIMLTGTGAGADWRQADGMRVRRRAVRRRRASRAGWACRRSICSRAVVPWLQIFAHATA